MYRLNYIISLLCFVIILGVFGLILPKKYFENQKKLFSVQVILENVEAPSIVKDLQDKIEGFEIIDRALFIHKSVAINMMKEYLSKDINDLFLYNPLPDILRVYFKPEYIKLYNIENWVSLIKLEDENIIKRISFDEKVLANILYQESIIIPITSIFGWSLIGLSFLGIIFIYISFYKYIQRRSFIIKDQIMRSNLKNEENKKIMFLLKIKKIGRASVLEFAIFQLLFVGIFMFIIKHFVKYAFVKKYLYSIEDLLIYSVIFYLTITIFTSVFTLISVRRVTKKQTAN